MSDPIDPATIGVALDEAEANGLHPEFTALLKAMVGKAGLLERAVVLLEDQARAAIAPYGYSDVWTDSPLVQLIAEHRGETPEATLARLSPPLRTTNGVTLGDLARALPIEPTQPRMRIGRHFTEAELEEIRNLGRPRIDPRARP